MRDFFLKYMKVEDEPIAEGLVDPVSLRGTWLKKVHQDGLPHIFYQSFLLSHLGIKKIRHIIHQGSFFFAIGVDETDDPRPSNEYLLTVELLLIPKIEKVDDSIDVQRFHLTLDFPTEVNSDTIAGALDKVCAVHLLHIAMSVCRPWTCLISGRRMCIISCTIPQVICTLLRTK